MNLINKILLESDKKFLSSKFKFLYHLTPYYIYEEYVKNEGLKPFLSKKLNKYYNETNAIHLLNTIRSTETLATQLWKYLPERKKKKSKGKYALLKIDMSKVPVKEMIKDNNFEDEGVLYFYKIPKNAIILFKIIDVLEIINQKYEEERKKHFKYNNLTNTDKKFLIQISNKQIFDKDLHVDTEESEKFGSKMSRLGLKNALVSKYDEFANRYYYVPKEVINKINREFKI